MVAVTEKIRAKGHHCATPKLSNRGLPTEKSPRGWRRSRPRQAGSQGYGFRGLGVWGLGV